MASLSVPPPVGSAPTRHDWRHTGGRGSAIRGANRGRGGTSSGDRGRGGRGARRGGTPARGGKGHSSPPKEKNTNTPTANPVPAKSTPSVVTSQMTIASKNSSSQHAADKPPSLTIEPASPVTSPHSASTTSTRPSARRRRSHNKPSGATISSENLTVEALASAVKARKSRSGPASPHPKDPPSKNPPKNPPVPHSAPAVTSFSTKTNIDSLVEHVRALAMDHRPSTPGSHIDWADEDDSLPDLDDWGVPPSSVTSTDPNPGTTKSTTESIDKAKLQLMSPILDDTLKQLPHSFDKTSSSPSVGSGSLSPNIANRAPVPPVNGLGDGASVAEAQSSPVATDKLEDHSQGLSEPPSQSGPTSPIDSHPLGSSLPPEQAQVSGTGPSKDIPPHLSSPPSELPAPTSSITPPVQSGRSLANSIHAPPCTPPDACEKESEADTSIKCLTTSNHAPAPQSGESESGPPEETRPEPASRNFKHGRSQTVGRPSPFFSGSKRGFLSGSSTPAGVATKGPQHGRTQSSPVTHRRQHSRPVITMDAMSRLAKTLGTALPKREVAATNSATSSE